MEERRLPIEKLEPREFNEIRNNIDGVVGGGVTDLYVSTGM